MTINERTVSCPACRQPVAACTCPQPAQRAPAADGTVRVSREKQHRGGKVVTVVRDLPGVKMEMGRLLPGQLQHLVTQSEGDFAQPQFVGPLGHCSRLPSRWVASCWPWQRGDDPWSWAKGWDFGVTDQAAPAPAGTLAPTSGSLFRRRRPRRGRPMCLRYPMWSVSDCQPIYA